MTRIAPGAAAALRRDLCTWYERHRRDLPWRRTRDPYAIWISETMLQQTRVEAVLEPYARFLERFPDLASLAAASEEDVLAAWSGLGYYRRARALAHAARVVLERHEGRLPASPAELARLPGVGPYTAGALASIAFDEPAPLVDGNVARVFARLFAIAEPIDAPATRRELWVLAAALVPPAAAGEPRPSVWSQALMELGALVCTPQAPHCSSCPLARRCRARRAGLEHELPLRRARPASVPVRLESLLVEHAGQVLLVRRPPHGRMARLWELPTRELAGPGGLHLWPAEFPAPPGCRLERTAERWLELTHTITRHRIALAVHRARLLPARALSAAGCADGWRFCAPYEREGLGLTGMTLKILDRIALAVRPGEDERVRAPAAASPRPGALPLSTELRRTRQRR